MNKARSIGSLLLAFCLVLSCAACQSEQDSIYSQAMADDGVSGSSEQDAASESALQTPQPEGGSGETLTIKTVSYLKSSSIDLLAEEFMQLHPQVKIEFDYELGDGELNSLSRTERSMRQESFYTQLRLELAAGEGEYLLYNVQEDLDLPSVSGLLEDLGAFFENDPEIDPDEYFTEVLDAFAVSGKTPVLPLSFMYNGIFFSKPVLQSLNVDSSGIQSVSCDEILDWYEQAAEDDPELNLIFTSPGKDILFTAEKCRYIDLENKSADFESPDFLRFLERTAAVSNDDPELDTESEIGISDPGLMNEKLRCMETGADPAAALGNFAGMFGHLVTVSRPALAAQMNVNLAGMISVLQPMEYVAGPYPYTSSDGRLGIVSCESFALPVNCKNKDLAWEFMKYCVRPRESMDFSGLGSRQRYTSDIPLSKTNFQNSVEYIAENGVSLMVAPPQFDSLSLPDMTWTLEQILSLPLVNTGAYGIDVQEFLDEYYVNGLTTPEQCAKKLQERAAIWLNE